MTAQPYTPSASFNRRAPFFRYACAAALVGLATLLRMSLQPILEDNNPFFSFLIAVAVASSFGLGPALFTLCAGGLFAHFFFVPVRWSFTLPEPHHAFSLVGYYLVGGAIIVFGETRKAAQQRAEKNAWQQREEEIRLLNEALESRVRERTTELERAYNQLEWEHAERKRAEVYHAHLAAIVESSLDAIVGKNLDGTITSWNKGAETIFGYTASEMVGTSIMRLIPADRQDDEKYILGTIKRGESIEHFESMRQTKDGRLIEVSITASPIKDATGEVIGVSQWARDVTESKRAARALEDSHALLRAVIEGVPQAVFVKDLQGRYLLMNTPGAHLIGKETAEVVGRDDAALFDAETAQRIMQVDRGVMESGKVETYEGTATAAGVTRTYLTSKAPFRGAHGEVLGVIGISRDITERKQADEAIQQLAAIVRSSDDAIIGKTLDGVIVSWNHGAETLYGYNAEEVKGRSISLLVPPDRMDEVPKILEMLRRGKGIKHYETVRKTKDGRLIDVSLTISPIRDRDHRVTGASTIARNITERKHAENTLKESSRRFEETLNSVNDLFVSFDDDWHYTFVNEKAAAFTGHQPGDLLGRIIWELFPQAIGGPFWRHLHDAAVAKKVRIFESYYEAHGRWYEHRVYPAERGLSVLTTDITDRKRAEVAHAHLAAIVESSLDAIVGNNLDGTITSWNAGAERLFGYTAEEIVGRPVYVIVPADRHEEEGVILRRIRRGERVEHFETIRVRKDGSLVNVSLAVSPILNAARGVMGASKIARDITQSKEGEQAVKQYADRLQALSRRLLVVQEEERRHLARELHDEFGQMLSAITLHIHAAQGLAGTGALPQLDECSTLLQQAAEQVRSLALELRPAILDILGLEATLRWLVEQHQQRTGCEVEVVGHLSGAPLSSEMVITCFRMVQESLTNVVRHAMARHVWIELSQSESTLELVVRDDGLGFDVAPAQEQAARRGSLGLLGMSERVHLLDGNLQVESEPGRGTRIHASFPLSEVPDQPADPEE